MKKTTACCVLLTLLLAAGVSGTTFAAAEEPGQYTHPEAGFGFVMPAGWYAVDSRGLRFVTKDSAEIALEVIRQIPDIETLAKSTPVVFLFPRDGAGMDYMANINVTVSDTGTPISMDALLSIVDEQLESQYSELYPDYTILTPAFAVEFGGHEVGVHCGAYSLWETVMETHQIYMLEGASLYTVTIIAPMDMFAAFHPVAAGIVESFVMP